MSKKLPIVLQNELNGYLTYAFPYSILCSSTIGRIWIENHYHYAGAYINEDKDINLEYLDGVNYGNFQAYDDVVQMKIQEVAIENIDDYIRGTIDNNEFIVLFLDEFYRSSSPLFRSAHLLHEILVYGYDDRNIYYIAFDRQNKFAKLQMTEQDIKEAYKAGFDIEPTKTSKWIEYKRVISCTINKLIHERKPQYTLAQYCFGGVRLILGNNKAKYNMYCGIDDTLLYIEKIIATKDEYQKMIPYAGMHSLYESKRFIHKWLKNSIDARANEYESTVLPEFNKARMIYLKELITSKSLYRSVLHSLEKGYAQEKKILSYL